MGAIERVMRFIAAIFAASIAAGPVFCFSIALASRSWDVTGTGLDLVSFASGAIPVGAFFSFVPNLVGTTIMATLGAQFHSARSPFVWIGAGALGGLLLIAILTLVIPLDPVFVAAMVLTGMACAGICRVFTRWPEFSEAPQA